jgi:hypothetical protein
MPVGGGALTSSPGAVTQKLEADFSGTAFGGTPTWTDITGWWMSSGTDPGGSSATIPWGRQDQSTTVESSTTSFTLNNSDGRFTPGKTGLTRNLLPLDSASAGRVSGGTSGFSTNAGASLFLYTAGVFTDDWDSSVLGVDVPNGYIAQALVFMLNGASVTAGQTYTAGVEISNPPGSTIGVTAAIRFVDGSGAPLSTPLGNTIPAGTKAYSTVTAVAPAGAVTAYVYTYSSVAQSSGGHVFVYHDNFSIELGSTFSNERVLPYYPNVKRRVRMRHTITDGTTTLTLFDGYVDSWSVAAQTDGPTLATVSLSDGFARLSASTQLRSMIIEEMLLDSPSVLYPLDEAEGATSAGDITGHSAAATVTASKYGAGTVTFGASSTMVGATAAAFASPGGATNVATPAMSYLSQPNGLPAGAGWTDEIFFLAPAATPLGFEYLVYVPGTSAIPADGLMHYSISSVDGTLNVTINGTAGTTLTLFTPATVCDGKWHQAAVQLSADGKTGTLVVDGVVSATVTAGSDILWRNSFLNIAIGANLVGGAVKHPLNTSVALRAQYATVLSTARLAAHYNAAMTAFAGESTSARWARLRSYRPNTGGTATATMGTVGSGDIAGMSLGDALTDTATAEGGVIQSNRGSLTLIGRANWYDPATTLTLDAANGEVDLPTTWRDDTQGLVNDVTVDRPNGATQRVVNAASVAADGISQTSITANLNSDRDAADMAGWLVAVGVREQLDSPTLTVNLYARSSAALTMAVCALKTYDVVTLTNLPASAPASTMTFQVQGGTYTVGANTFTAELYTTTMPPGVLRTDATPSTYTKLDSGLKFAW